MFTWVLGRYVTCKNYNGSSSQTFRGALIASMDSCAEIKRAPSVA